MKNRPDTILKRVLKGETFKRPPCWLMRQAGRYLPEYRAIRSKHASFQEFIFIVPDVVEVTLQPLKRFNLDAAIIFSDILVIPMMLKQKVEFLENKGPQLSTLSTPDQIYALPTNLATGTCQAQYEAISKVRDLLPFDKSLIGFAGGPWTVASYMLEGQTSKTFSKIKSFAYRYPEAFNFLLRLIADLTAEHLIQQIKAGADIIKIFDSWAGSVPESKIHEWLILPHQIIIQKIKAVYPDVPTIIFLKGLELSLSDYIQHVNVNCLALGSNINLSWAKEALQSKVCLQGSLDPQALVVGGDILEKEVERELQILGKGPYIFNLGHGIVPETPPENVQKLLELIDKYAQ